MNTGTAVVSNAGPLMVLAKLNLLHFELQEAPLDQGERETLVLAMTLGGAMVLVDETAGREMARTLGLKVRGSLGVLIEAYRRKLIGADQLRLYLTEIARRQDIWINPALVKRLLREVLGDQGMD